MQEWIDQLRIELNGNIDAAEKRSSDLIDDKINELDDTISKRLDALGLRLNDFALTSELEALKDDHDKRLDNLDINIKSLEETDGEQQTQIDYLLEEIKKKVNQDDLDARLKYLFDNLPKDSGAPVLAPSTATQYNEVVKVVEKQVGPEISQKMIDAWNDNLKITHELKTTVKLIDERVEKNNHRVSLLEKKIFDFALKSDVEKVKQEVGILGDHLDKLSDKVSELKKWTQNEMITVMKHFDNYTKKDEFNLLRQRVEQLEKLFKELKKQLDQLEYKFKTMKSGDGGPGIDPELLDTLRNQLDNLRKEFEKHRDNTNRNLNDLNVTMPTKADKQDLIDLEQRMNDKLNEILRQLLELIPNKDELNKKFAAINRKLKEIFELLANRGGHDHEDDAMFSKKHLGPHNCASCEKDIVNLQGYPADYYVWKRMP